MASSVATPHLFQGTRFVVFGRPQPQGSAKSLWRPGMKRPVITTDNKNLKSWRNDVAAAAFEAVPVGALITRPRAARVELLFVLAKPASKSKKIVHPTTKPDVDKLVRGCLDALTGIAFEDDSQVVEVISRKAYGLPERTEIFVEGMEGI